MVIWCTKLAILVYQPLFLQFSIKIILFLKKFVDWVDFAIPKGAVRGPFLSFVHLQLCLFAIPSVLKKLFEKIMKKNKKTSHA